MTHEESAAQRIALHLTYTPEQLSFMGRIFALEQVPDLVASVKINRLSNTYYGPFPVFSGPDPPSPRLSVRLNQNTKQLEHYDLKGRIESALAATGPELELFGYCNQSYGLEIHRVDVHFGFYTL